MKKIFAFMTAAVMTAGLLSGCGSSSAEATTAAETTVVETTTRGSTEQILGIEDVSQVLGMILVSLGAVILSALIWLGIRSKRA